MTDVMKRIPFLVCILSVMLAASCVFAGDYADLKFIGFSADGRYLAFEESGSWDGAGGDYATTYFVNVAKNTYALPPAVFEWEMDSMKESARRPLLARYNRNVAGALAKLKIVRRNTGTQVVAHMLTDWSFVKKTESETYFYNSDGTQVYKQMPNYEGAFLSRGDSTETVIFNPWINPNGPNTNEYYELTLKKSPGNSGPCAESEDALKIELTLKDNSHHRNLGAQVLQKDKELSKARNCPYGYRIEQVYFYKNNIAVFLNMFSQGFEGPDMRYMVVTGQLEYESNSGE